MISILLVDDEPLANRQMRALLAAFTEVELTGVAESLAEARACLAARMPDVVFLDVEMPGGTTFALLPEIDDSTQVVFVTAHESHAVEAFAVAAVDYLVKPVTPERLAETLRRLTTQSGEKPVAVMAEAEVEIVGVDAEAEPRLQVSLRNSRQKTVIRVAEICWIESLRNYTRVALRSPPRLLIFRRRLGEWLADLPMESFARVSRSEVIHLAFVSGTEWTARGKTVVFFGAGVEPLTLGRVSTLRLNALLDEGDF
ncbi:MAG: LytTR family DNA-binding domain-containing protein [Pirellulales bacterium]